jgi:type I restriction enzyme, R subunit
VWAKFFDGFLTPFRVKQVATTLDEYTFTPDDTVVEGEIEAGRVYGGVEELDRSKLSPLIDLRYGSTSDAILQLGPAEDIIRMFVGFQKYLYSLSPAGTERL